MSPECLNDDGLGNKSGVTDGIKRGRLSPCREDLHLMKSCMEVGMGPWGAIIMGFFGAVFFGMAIIPEAGWRSPLLLVPLVVFILLAALAIARFRAGRATPSANPRAGTVIGWSSAAEGVAIPIAATLLGNMGRSDLLLPAIALIVGLHFFPIAYAVPFPRFYLLGAALVAVAVLGGVLPHPAGWIVAGLGASAALWLASAVALDRTGLLAP